MVFFIYLNSFGFFAGIESFPAYKYLCDKGFFVALRRVLSWIKRATIEANRATEQIVTTSVKSILLKVDDVSLEIFVLYSGDSYSKFSSFTQKKW